MAEDGHIIPQVIEDEMKRAYLDYAMSVIIGRALPDCRDGLKPVHRRILYSMNLSGFHYNKSFVKCARIVGDVLGKFHPHGDQSVYDALVRMVQTFSLRYPLVFGQGNFGCFTKGTKVRLADGRSLSFEELISEDQKGKKNYTFTIDEQGQVKIARIERPRLTRKDAKLVKVIFDNKESVRCTPNHRFMLKDGTYKEAQYLVVDDSLMPLYSRLSTPDDGYKPKIMAEACMNHKVLSVEYLQETEDVYDLTVDKTHNFALAAGVFVHNSVDGDNAAAYRYTEAKLAKISEEILSEIDKDTVDFVDNFDGSLKEPVVLPSKIPTLLINGSTGIAVGMATNIPPHNVQEVCLGAIKLIDNSQVSIPELMEVIRGPDFPTGGIITGKQGIVEAYMTGRGKAVISSVIEVEEKKGKKSLVIKEVPYQVNKAELVSEIADNIREKRIEGVSDLRDESDKDGIRVVLELKANSMPEVVKNQVLNTTRAQSSFGIIFLSIVRGEPKTLSLRGLLVEFLEFRKEVVKRRTAFDLRQAEEKDHIVQGLIICLEHIDPIVELLKKAKDVETAKNALMDRFALSEKQAKAILEMRLSRLTALEQEKLREEHKSLLALIKELREILASEQRILDIIKKELQEISEKYGDKRKTQIVDEEVEMDFEDLIKEEDQVITLTNQGYIKRMPLETYKVQRRGGRGIIGLTPDENDFIERVFVASTHAFLMCFTDQGNVHWVKVYKVPEATRYAKGKAIVNLINLPKGEKISSIIPVEEYKEGLQLVMATKKGIIKKTELMAYSRPRAGGIIAINLEEGDELRGVAVTDETKNIFLATRNGNAVKFIDKAIRPVGRNSKGVRGVKVKGDDAVIGMTIVGEEENILTVTENGYGKKTLVSEYRLTNRGGSGVRNIICSDRNGKVVTIMAVNDHEELIFMSKNGIAIRVESKGISTIGRNTQGMRIMKLEEGDRVVSGTKFENEAGNGNETPADPS